LKLDRFHVGLLLVVVGGLLSLLNFSMKASNTYFTTVEQIVSWYIIGSVLSVAVILGAIMVYKEHVNLGLILALVPSLLFPIWLFLFVMFPRPEGAIAMVLYEAIASTGYLFLSLIGAITTLSTRLKGADEN